MELIRKAYLVFGAAVLSLLVANAFVYRGLRLLVRDDAESAITLLQTEIFFFFGALLSLLIVIAAFSNFLRDSVGRRVSATAIRDSEDNLKELLHVVQDYAVAMLDPKGTIISWNPGAERMTGRTATQAIGQNFSIFSPPEDIEQGRPVEILRLATATGRYEEQSVRLRPDGSRFSVASIFTALFDSSGGLRGFLMVSRDPKESAESEAKYRGLLEAAPDAMVVVSQGGEIVLLNVQAEKQFGYSRDELVGQPVTNIVPEGFAERIVADDLRSAADALSQQIGTGLELSARRKDGSEFPIEIMLSPLSSAQGILVTAAIRDITARKNSERYLARMEGRYRGLLEAAPDAMVVVNQYGAIVLLNVQAEKQFGYKRNELIGQQVTNLIPDGFAERLVADDLRSASEALAQQIGTGIELSALRKDGTEFPIEIMLSPLENEEGILVTAAIRDISVRRAADTHLAQMESRYRGLLEAAPDAMVVVNPEGEIVLLNVQAEKKFGYSRDELRDVRSDISLHVAADGVEALAFLRQTGEYKNAPRPEFILLDLNLPKMDGREVLAHIKEDESLKSIPTCILTTSSAEADIMRSYQLHANCYLTKPVQLDEFEALVTSINEFWLTRARLPLTET